MKVAIPLLILVALSLWADFFIYKPKQDSHDQGYLEYIEKPYLERTFKFQTVTPRNFHSYNRYKTLSDCPLNSKKEIEWENFPRGVNPTPCIFHVLDSLESKEEVFDYVEKIGFKAGYFFSISPRAAERLKLSIDHKFQHIHGSIRRRGENEAIFARKPRWTKPIARLWYNFADPYSEYITVLLDPNGAVLRVDRGANTK